MALNEQQIAALITQDRLKAFAPSIKASIAAALVRDCPRVFSDKQIDTPVRVAHFFAQISRETGGLKRLDENLSYTTISRLRAMFSKFKTMSDAEVSTYLKKPERLANLVYANRIGNGNEASGDGWAYRGSGLIQLTGRGNFKKAGEEIGIDIENNPDLVRGEDSCVRVAVAYWTFRDINSVAADSEDGVNAVTKKINPNEAEDGRKERRDNYKRARQIFV
jgi:putative chitinase